MRQEGEHDMSDDEQVLGPEKTPDDGLEEFVVDVPAGNDARPMTLHELQEAVEDESHPRHAEAVQRDKELAEQLRPAMDRLRQTVMEQSGMTEQLARIQKTVTASMPKLTPSIDLTKLAVPMVDMPKFNVPNPVTEQNQRWQGSMREQQEELDRAIEVGARAKAQRQQMDDHRAQQTLDVLVSMDAHLVQLNSRIEGVDARIEAGNTSSSKVAGWTIVVAVLTLLVTIAGIVITVLLSR